ncbi:MAG TPA: hypothetical protein VFU71_19615 [Burkholderiaceae bacterium]|nr:hypothetical protein [Burkholderiaceae bacterium]
MAVGPIDKFLQQHRAARFTARVREALAELGLQESKFRAPLRTLFREICFRCHNMERDTANPYSLAAEFFLRTMVVYPHVASGAVMVKGALIESIAILRSWHLKGRIAAERAHSSVEQIKQHLIEQLKTLDVSDEARLETELHLREL